jgi:hypothetical protein
MERLRKLIKEALSTPLKEDTCNCGCHSCENVGNSGVVLNESLVKKDILSENLRYHVDNQLPLTENTFRYGSDSFLNLWAEARSLYLREIIHVNEDDKEILEETDLGNFGLYENQKVALDLPTLVEYEMNDLLKIKANEIPLVDIMDRVVEKGGKNSPLYKDLEIEFRKDSIDMDEVKNILKDYGVYFEYDDILNLNESINSPAYKGREGYDDGCDCYPDDELEEAKDKKKNPPLGKPKRGGSKKFYVYVKNPKTKKIKKVSFGDTSGLSAKINNPEARRAFAARHDCKNKTDKTKASYWSCRLPRYAKLLGLKSSFSGFW